MIIAIIILLGIQYFILMMLVITDFLNMGETDKVLTSKERWITFGFPFGIYIKLGSLLLKFIFSLPERWSNLPDK